MKKQRTAKPRSNSMLGKIRREIELMEPWAYTNRRITVERVQELLSTGVQPPPLPARSPMSDAMKRFWAGKTPEERSAIFQRRREAKRRAKKAGK